MDASPSSLVRMAVVSSSRRSCMASSGVGNGLLCFRTSNIIGYCDGSDVNIGVRKSRSVIASSVWSSCMRLLLSLVKYALSDLSSLGRQARNWRRMSCLPIYEPVVFWLVSSVFHIS